MGASAPVSGNSPVLNRLLSRFYEIKSVLPKTDKRDSWYLDPEDYVVSSQLKGYSKTSAPSRLAM